MARKKAVQTAALVAAVFLSSPCWPQAMLGHAVGKSTDSPEQAKRGRQIYSDRCSHCHGLNMATASAAVFDLRTFPPDEKPRFVTSVTDGKRAMPAWGSVLKSEDVDALWAYVMTAKKK